MKTVNELLDRVRELHGITSDNALGKALGVKRQTVSNWRHGHAAPDPVACATIAGLTGEPLARVLGIVGEARAISREEKAVWRKLASAAVVLLAALPLGNARSADHVGIGATEQNAVVCIMRSVGAWLRTVFKRCHRLSRDGTATLLA